MVSTVNAHAVGEDSFKHETELLGSSVHFAAEVPSFFVDLCLELRELSC